MLSFLPKDKFKQFVHEHDGDKGRYKLKTWSQLAILLYAQASGKKSLREIETGLSMHENTWYHLGIKTVARSTLSDANSKRSYEIFEKLFYNLLGQCKEITPSSNKFEFENPLYSIDSSTINLCLSVFDWAKYRTTKGALKLHVMFDNRTAIPELVNITDGKVGDNTVFKEMDINILEKGSILVFDRAYIDYKQWKKIDENKLFFVSRIKSNQNIFVVGQHKDRKMEKGIISDEIVIFGDYNAQKVYPNKLRMVKYYNSEKKKKYTYLTNNFDLTAKQIADIYKDRWQIELFFKWIKQNLKIKTFLGTSKNAVMTQIWIAMIYYLLLAYIKFQTKFKKSLLELTRMIKETLLFRRNIIDLLSLETKTIFRIKRQKSPQMSFL
ncbi:IS4 family transposase [Patescibacteria group bacterium]|nr:IS4 family transposase [Patescibacteria group bacterium]